MDGDAPLPESVTSMLEGLTPVDPGLGKAAKKTAAQATNSLSVISDARQHLQSAEIHGQIRSFKPPPPYDEIFQLPIEGQSEERRKWAIREIEWFRTIVDQYKDGDYDPVQIEQDIIRLSSNLVFFSSWVNYIDSVSTHAERVRKEAESRAYLELRQWSESMDVNNRQFGSDTIKALAIAETKDQADLQTLSQSVSSTIKGFYYALKDFIAYLDRVSSRAQGERIASRRMT